MSGGECLDASVVTYGRSSFHSFLVAVAGDWNVPVVRDAATLTKSSFVLT